MKIEKISVNKTPDRPEGIDIDLVKPESGLEGRVMSFLLTSYLRERKDNFGFSLPERFSVDHRGEGSFVVAGGQGQSDLYEPPRPIAVVGVQVRGNRLAVVHGAINPPGSTTPDKEEESEPQMETDVAGAAELDPKSDQDTILCGQE